LIHSELISVSNPKSINSPKTSASTFSTNCCFPGLKISGFASIIYNGRVIPSPTLPVEKRGRSAKNELRRWKVKDAGEQVQAAMIYLRQAVVIFAEIGQNAED